MGNERVPMRCTSTPRLGQDDVSLRIEPPLVGRRFSMDVNEIVLAQIGAKALEAAVERLGQHVAYEHLGDIQKTVDSLLMDRAWAEPIIREALERAVREFVRDLFGDGR